MTALPLVKFLPAVHNEERVVQVVFDRNNELLSILKFALPMKWSRTMNCWYCGSTAYSANKTELYKRLANRIRIQDDCTDSESNSTVQDNTEQRTDSEFPSQPILPSPAAEKIETFKNWMRSRRYSESTVGTYSEALRTFLRYHLHKPPGEITNDDLIHFNNDHILRNKLSASYQNQVVNAIKLFYLTVENKKMNAELIHRPKRQKLLPNVLSKEEIKAILNAHNNIKHKAMLSLIYSCGLRCGELLRLKPEHVDSRRNILIIKQSKGRKDRIAPLSTKIVELLREYFQACKPKVYLFEGQTPGAPYDARSLQQVLKQSLKKAKINKPVSLHWLRHSYATHLLENGTDLRYIQEILGHSSSKTTEIYTHVSTKSIQNIVSPFDFL